MSGRLHKRTSYAVFCSSDVLCRVRQAVTDHRVVRPRREGVEIRDIKRSHIRGPVLKKALEGVRVLDMTHVQSGPSCTQILAWLGADVVKLEAPTGDITRRQLRDVPDADSLYFTMLNGNKKSITLNLKSDRGKEIFAELVKNSDVLVENFGP